MRQLDLKNAITDILLTFKDCFLVGMMGWQDIRNRYKRSALGPFWLTISMSIMVGMMGVLFSKIFNTSLKEFLPYLSIGMILWGYISNSITEGCQSFVAGQSIIKQLPLPIFLHVARMLWRNMIILAHNIVIVPIVFLIVHYPLSWMMLISIPGYCLLLLNLSWIVLLLAILCARYRDLQQMINSVLQIAFYLTPIMWMPNKLSGRTSLYLVNSNPVYHLINIVRAPLLGSFPTLLNWIVSLVLAVIGWAFTLLVYSYAKRRIAYWL